MAGENRTRRNALMGNNKKTPRIFMKPTELFAWEDLENKILKISSHESDMGGIAFGLDVQTGITYILAEWKTKKQIRSRSVL